MKRFVQAVTLLALLTGLLAGCHKQEIDCIALPPMPETEDDQPETPGGEKTELASKPEDDPVQPPEKTEEPPEDRTVYLEEPPALYVTYDGQSVRASQNSSTWTFRDKKTGEEVTVCACAVHPMDGRQWLTNIAMSEEKAVKLEFDVSPNSAWVCCWPAELIGTDEYNTKQKLVALEDDGTLELPEGEGGWVFSIVAQWDDTYGYGQCEYSFLIEPAAEAA